LDCASAQSRHQDAGWSTWIGIGGREPMMAIGPFNATLSMREHGVDRHCRADVIDRR